MSKKHIPLFFAGFFFTSPLVAQNIVSVNPSTGTANVVIPIYTVTSGQIAMPVSISYSGTGVKTRDVENTAGMNWQLNAGGSVNRVVRQLPDDVSKDSMNVSVYGWMSGSNSGAAYINSFAIQNDGSTCSKGQNDIDSINTHMPYIYDTEPDLFYVNAPGLSLEMIYDRASAAFHPVNYQDVKITYTLVGGSGKNASQIASFTITNDRGWVYSFAAPETVFEKTISGTPQYFTTKYNQYKNGITYYDSWNLVSITDPNGNAVTMTYTTAVTRNSTDSVNLYLGGSTTKSYQYLVAEAVTPQVLNTMSSTNVNSSNTRLSFHFNYPGEVSQTGQTLVTIISGMGHTWNLGYNAVSYNGHYTRAFLTSFTDAGCATPVYYQFAYNGVNTALNTTVLPDSTSTQVDYWGYYSSTASSTTLRPYVFINPSSPVFPRYLIDASGTPGSAYTYYAGTSHRAVSPSNVADGSLNKIIYAQGGSTTLIYEPNYGFDPTIGANVPGAGIRIKQIIDSAGSGTTNPVVRNYSYVNPGTTQSSGVGITLPEFAFTIPYSGSATGQTLWTDATALSDYDLSTDDHTVLYAYSELTQAGAGQTVYNNTTAGNFLQSSSPPSCGGCTAAEWFPTLNYAASYSCPSTNGPIANLTYSYPFIPNPNYDFERGLPISVKNYNDTGAPVSETDYTYVRTDTTSVINAFKADDGPTGSVAKFYNKYKVFYNTSELTASVTKKVYDSQTLSQSQSTATNFTYGSTYHKLLTKDSTTNSDGSIIKNFFWYVKDYNASSSSNANIQALYELRLANINSPVESYQTITRGSTTVTTKAGLTLFSASTNGSTTHYLPSQQFKLLQPNGESAFNKFSISTGLPVRDTGYICVANMEQYDNTAYPQTVDDNHKRVATSFLDFLSGTPTAVFKNAHYNEVAFQDFDSQFAPNVNTFTISGGSFTPVGSHAGNAAGLATGQSITSGTITKNTTAVNYIISFWINVSTTTTLTFTGATLGPFTYTVPGWTYHEYSVAASSLGSTFSIGFSASQNVSLDDLLIYPDVSEATTATYDQTSHYKICQTNTNGVSAYFTNDQWGRVLYAYDQDHNIVQRNQYVSLQNAQSFYKPAIVAPASVYKCVSAIFGNSSAVSCYTNGLYYKWTFGDGATDSTSSPGSVQHSYADTGHYTMTLSVTSPLFGTKIDTVHVTVTNLPSTSVTYINTCTPGGHIPSAIVKVEFLQDTTVVYTFNTAQLEAGQTITPGAYTIQIYPVGTQYNSSTDPTGYGSVLYTGATLHCWNYTGGSYFQTTDTTTCTPTINFEIQPGSCP